MIHIQRGRRAACSLVSLCSLALVSLATLPTILGAAPDTTPAPVPATPPPPPVLATPTPLGPISQPLWMRYPALSPDGRQIAFSFEGNIYVVPVSGGPARALVATDAHAFAPVWSPDSQYVAYAADTYGNFDLFLVAAAGGPSRRLTFNSAPEVPTSFTPDGKFVVFKAHLRDAPSNVMFPVGTMSELYKVSTDGVHRPEQILTTPALGASYDKDGSHLLYEDIKGYENLWRKHEVSSVTHDIWIYDAATGKHTELTDWAGEDRNPVWSPDQKSVYFLSERSGTFNVWQFPLSNPSRLTQLTKFEHHPVRFLSAADNGDLCFGYDGEIYRLPAGAKEPQKVSIQIATDTRKFGPHPLILNGGAKEVAVSRDGEQVAFIVRGEVFVTSVEYGDTKRITDTPQQERSVDFAPDGRHLVFAGERDGAWNLYEASLPGTKDDEPYFFDAPEVGVRTLLANGKENFQPRYSPDGKEVAYLENRTTLKVLTIATGDTRTILPGDYNYSYADGDQWFDWSPDGKWFLVTFLDRNRWSQEVGLIDSEGKGPVKNLTLSGYEDFNPVWALEGKAMVWVTDRMGLHGNGGGRSPQLDAYAMYFTQESYDRSRLSKSEFALLKKREDREKEKKDKDKDKGKDKTKDGDNPKDAPAPTADDTQAKDAKPAAPSDTKPAAPADDADKKVDEKKDKDEEDEDAIKLPDPVELELTNLEDRTHRLTLASYNMLAFAVTPDGETLLTLTRSADGADLWITLPRDGSTRRVASFPFDGGDDDDSSPVSLVLTHDGKTAFLLVDGDISSFKVPDPDDSGDVNPKPVKFTARMNLDPSAERAYIFEHVWRQTKEKFYKKDMNGVDWDFYKAAYARQLPYVADNWDFTELLSEMAGELNASHMGSGYRPHRAGSDATASLGAFYDPSYAGAGVKIAEIIEGGPLSAAHTKLKPGVVIEAIDGTAIPAGGEFDSLLNRKVGQHVRISALDPATGEHFDETVKPISPGEEGELLYKRWVKTCRETVDRLSGGRIGYVHVESMDDGSYRDAFAEILGRQSGKEALIVDTRFNGGGNLHDELATLLSGKQYLEFLPRGQSLGWESTQKWTKPSCVLISESNYSDAHLFPWTYRHLGIGKLVGMPVPGTGTAVWWEFQQDDSIYYGIPMVGFRDAKGEFMEQTEIEPDVRVADDPARVAKGEDQQLESAVELLLKK